MTDHQSDPRPNSARSPLATAVVAAVWDAHWPQASCPYALPDAWDMVVATILADGTSAHRARHLAAVLAEHLAGPRAYVDLNVRVLERFLVAVVDRRATVRALIEAGRAIHLCHGGRVPASLHDLVRLPGLGPRRGALVWGDHFQAPIITLTPAGCRVVARFGWAEADIEAVRAALEQRFPPAEYRRRSHQLVACAATWCRRHPRCDRCPLAGVCPSAG